MRPYGQQPTRFLCPRDSIGKNTGVGCHFLLCHLLLDHIQFTLTHGPYIPGPMQHCSLLHRILLSPPDAAIIKCCFCLGAVIAFFLGLLISALRSSPVAYRTLSNLGGSSSSGVLFCLFILFIRFSRQESWSALLPFPPPVDQVLSELFTMTYLS